MSSLPCTQRSLADPAWPCTLFAGWRRVAEAARVAHLALWLLLCAPYCVAQTLTLSAQADVSALRPISARVIEEAFRRAGLGVVFKPLPLERAIEEANDGVTDGDMHRIADVARFYPNLLTVPTPVNKVYLVIYGRTADILTRTRAEITRLKIGYPRGVLIQRKYSQGMNITEARVYATTFDMLFNGRVDVLMMSYVDTAAQIAEGRFPATPVMWPHVWAVEPLYLVLHKRHAALVPRIDAALRQMAREGLIQMFYDDALRDLHIAPLPADSDSAGPTQPRR